MKTITVLLVLTVLTVLTVRGTTAPQTAPPPPPTVTTTSTTTTTTSSTTPPPTTTTTPAGTPLAGQPMTASDGKNYASCRDGACQVLVNVGSRIRVNSSTGTATVQISAVGAEGISITLLGDSGFTGTVSSGPNQSDFMKFNEIQISAVAVDGGAGVLRFSKS